MPLQHRPGKRVSPDPPGGAKSESGISIYVSLASLLFAGLSLFVSWTTLGLERTYKEASIQPYLTVATNGRELFMEVRNSGPGPAILKTVTFSFGNRELRFAADVAGTPEADEWAVEYYEFFYKALGSTDNTLMETFKSARPKSNFSARGVIPSGDKRIVFSVVNIEQVTRAYPQEEQVRHLSSVFLRALRKIDYKICYTSITGGSSYVTQRINEVKREQVRVPFCQPPPKATRQRLRRIASR